MPLCVLSCVSHRDGRHDAGCALAVWPASRDVQWEPQEWSEDASMRLEVCGDSRVVIQWLNGIWPAKFLPYERSISRSQQQLYSMSHLLMVAPRENKADFCRHIYRELNTMADKIANKYCNDSMLLPYVTPAKRTRAFFDGSKKGNKAAFGWAVFAAMVDSGDEESQWQLIAWKSSVLPDGASITAAELEAATSVISFLNAYFQGHTRALANISDFQVMDHKTIQVLSLADII